MDQELYNGIKKKKRGALGVLCQEHLNRSWFLCWKVTEDTALAVPLMVSAWKAALEEVGKCPDALSVNFQSLLSQAILSRKEQGLEPDTEFASLPSPKIGKQFRLLEKEADQLPASCRKLYWLGTYGGLQPEELARASGLSCEEVEERLHEAASLVEQGRKKWTMAQRVAGIQLSTLLKDAAGNGFSGVEVPISLREALWKEIGLPVRKRVKKPLTRKKAIALGVGIAAAVLLVTALVVWLCWNFPTGEQ